MLAAWKHFWFKPADPINLGAIRFFICCGGAVFYLFMKDGHPAGYYKNWVPISFYQLLPGPISWELLEWIRRIWLVCIFLAGLGLAFRFTITLGFLAGLFYGGYTYNFGWVYHSNHLFVMALGILAFSRAGDAFRLFNKSGASAAPSGAYRWPVRLIQCYVVYMFFICGLQKLWMAGGLAWVSSNSFYHMLTANPFQSAIAVWIQSQPPWVAKIFAGSALFVVELGAPLALVNGHFALAFALMWASFHVMVNTVFGIHTMFFSHLFVYTVFVNWAAFFALFPFSRVRVKA